MAKKNVQVFHTYVKQEGTAGATRGKVTVAMCEAMGAGDGDIIEWSVVDGEVTGGRVLSKSERKELEREKRSAVADRRPAKKSKPAAKPAKKGKKVAKKSSDDEAPRKPKKPTKKGKKGGKRVTKVSYEEPKKKGKKGLKKPKLRVNKYSS